MLYLRICYRELCYKELVVYQTRLVHREQVQIGEAGRGGGVIMGLFLHTTKFQSYLSDV